MDKKREPLKAFMDAKIVDNTTETEEIELSESLNWVTGELGLASAKPVHNSLGGMSAKSVHNSLGGMSAKSIHNSLGGMSAKSVHNSLGGMSAKSIHNSLGGMSAKSIHNSLGLANGYAGVVKGISDVGIFGSKLGVFSPSLKKIPSINLGLESSLKSIQLGTQYIETIQKTTDILNISMGWTDSIGSVNRPMIGSLDIDLPTLDINLPEFDGGLRNKLAEIDTLWKIDFAEATKRLEPQVRKLLNRNYRFSQNAVENFWCLDEECIENHIESVGETFDEAYIVKYIEDNFETYKTNILEANMFSTQKSIIEESIKAYDAGLHQLATLPLIAAYDNVISRWLKGILNEPYQNEPVYIENIVTHTKVLRKAKINVENIDEMQKSYDAILIRAIFKMTSNLFITDSEDLTKMNRNSIMHGAFDYTKLDKGSFYKILSLLKTCLSLSNIETVAYITPYVKQEKEKDTKPVA